MDDILKPGDPYILYHGVKDNHLMFFTPGFSFGSRKGQVQIPDTLSYGQCLTSSSGNPFLILRPSTAELTMKLKRRTTIIYPKDAGWLLMNTDVSAGSNVLECGTGSGALTVALARLVGDGGRVHSVERREDHHLQAKENVNRYGLSHRVEFYLVDAETEGFPVCGVSTCFIDVPEPWTLVQAARDALEGGGFWVSVSPSFNQVEKTVLALEAAHFTAMETVEILERRILVREGKTRPSERNITHTAFLTRARKGVEGMDPVEE